MITRALVALAALVGIVVAAVVAALVLGWLHTYRVAATSMEPTLRPGDRIVVVGFHGFGPRVGEVVAVRVPQLAVLRCGSGGIYVKRIAAIRHGLFFLLGDNRKASCDSREWGAVARSRLVGRVVLVYWPASRLGFG